MPVLSVGITLKQPLLISHAGTGDENSANALPYIPGSVLRGALIQRYVNRNGPIDLNHGLNSLAQQLFFSDRVRFLNCYPQTSDGRRMLPRPLSWRIEKGMDEQSGNYYDYALADAGLPEPKSPAGIFWTYVNPGERREVVLHTPRRQIGMHNASEQRFRKDGDSSTVFRYDALAADQTFAGTILCDDPTVLAEQIVPLFEPGDLYIGRSRNAGYGWVQAATSIEGESWAEYLAGPPPTGATGGDSVTMTLLSHAVLREETGRLTTDLVRALGQQFKPQAAFVGTDVMGGFNRTWGLPYLQMPVLCAGSVFVFDGDMRKTLVSLVETGIGERRNEGFGRIAVDLNRQPALPSGRFAGQRKETQPIDLSGPARTIANAMVERLYREVLDQKLLALLNQSAMSIQDAPENSQLSQLRLVARRAWQQESPQAMTDYLNDLASMAKGQYQRAHVGSQTLYGWLKAGWEENKLWSENFHIPIAELPRVGDVRAEATDALKVEYMARLVNGLCNKSVKTSQREAKS